jgi:excisionase family DNA binding protein
MVNSHGVTHRRCDHRLGTSLGRQADLPRARRHFNQRTLAGFYVGVVTNKSDNVLQAVLMMGCMATWASLNEERVKALAGAAEDRPGFAVVWPNILWTAELFWQAQAGRDRNRRVETWHHLVMAVGNFKRQGGTQICLLDAAFEDQVPPGRPESCSVQTLAGEVELRRNTPETWTLLTDNKEGVKGVQVAIRGAAEYLGVSRATIERLVFRGELPIVKVAGSTRYDVEDLNVYIAVNRCRNRKRTPFRSVGLSGGEAEPPGESVGR